MAANTLPLEKQSKRVHQGLMPTYYYRFEIAYPDVVTEVYTFYHYDFKLAADSVCGVLTLVYSDNTKSQLVSASNPMARIGNDVQV